MDKLKLRKNMENHVGKTIALLEPHEHAKSTGVLKSVDVDKEQNPFFNVELNDGNNTTVSDSSQVMFFFQCT